MNIHVARTPHFCTGLTHTCCQGQTGSLTVRPDTARCRVVASTAAFHARVRGSVPGLGGLKETKMFLPHPRVKVSIVGSLRDREVAFSWPSLAYMCTKVA